ncbi:MAG TPA: hypothetical protein VF759_17915 [Allosphingosinicella sp.]|jgi:hypothetical protein
MTDDARISTASIRFDALHFGEGELNLDLTLQAFSMNWGMIRSSGTISRSRAPSFPPVQVRVTGLYQSLGDSRHFHLSGLYTETGGAQGPFSASGAVDGEWNGRGVFVYHNFDSGPCVIARQGAQ